MTPFIIITAGLTESADCIKLNRKYIKAVERFGGFAVSIYGEDETAAEKAVEFADGIIFSGGGDINPLIFNKEPDKNCGQIDTKRDIFELALCKKALKKNIPVLGICRGSQILNVALGGNIIQDIKSNIKHMQYAPKNEETHSIIVVKNSILWHILNKNKITVNSFHHQSVGGVGENVIISAKSIDGVTEAIESPNYNFVLGVQWHPEHLLDIEEHSNIFKTFMQKSEKYKEEKHGNDNK